MRIGSDFTPGSLDLQTETILKHELIICTKDRVDDLQRCLMSVCAQSEKPRRILIVDASRNNQTSELVSRFADRLPLELVKSQEGLTLQRNQGVNMVLADTDVVHFIDDDVLLDKYYFSQILKVFEKDTTRRIGGCGGFITNKSLNNPRWYDRLFLLNSSKEGAVLRSWQNILVFSRGEPRRVEWLSGCSMSYRKGVLESYRFDENLVGYCLGEDIDFSFRVGLEHELVVNPHAQLEHHPSSKDRMTKNQWARNAVVHRVYFVNKNMNDLRCKMACWWSIVGCIVVNLIRGFLKANTQPLMVSFGTLLGVWDVLLGLDNELGRSKSSSNNSN